MDQIMEEKITLPPSLGAHTRGGKNPSGPNGPCGHRRSPPLRCPKVLRRPDQLTMSGRLRRSNRNVWSGFRRDMNEDAWQLRSSCAVGPWASMWPVPSRHLTEEPKLGTVVLKHSVQRYSV